MEEKISEELKNELHKELDVLVRAFIDSAVRDGKQCMEELKIGRLTLIEMKTLHAIGTENAKSMKEVASYLDVAVSTPTTTIDRLVKKNLVKRYTGTEDRRMVFVELTESGKKLISEFVKKRIQRAELVLSIFTPKEVIPAIEKMREISAVLRKE